MMFLLQDQVNDSHREAICLECFTEMLNIILLLGGITDIVCSVGEAPDDTSENSQVVVGTEVQIPVCVCLLPVN